MVRWVRCPHCSSRSTARVVYGEVTAPLKELSEAGYIHLGARGAEVGGGRPDRFCIDCGNQWETARSIVARTYGIPSF